jgi:hypothetical protein
LIVYFRAGSAAIVAIAATQTLAACRCFRSRRRLPFTFVFLRGFVPGFLPRSIEDYYCSVEVSYRDAIATRAHDEGFAVKVIAACDGVFNKIASSFALGCRCTPVRH